MAADEEGEEPEQVEYEGDHESRLWPAGGRQRIRLPGGRRFDGEGQA